MRKKEQTDAKEEAISRVLLDATGDVRLSSRSTLTFIFDEISQENLKGKIVFENYRDNYYYGYQLAQNKGLVGLVWT